MRCFICDDLHMVRGYSKKFAFSSIEWDDRLEKIMIKLDVILSSVKSKKGRKRKGLMFVNIIVAGKKLNALVDTSSLNLFISEEAAHKLDLKVEKEVE